MAEKPTVIIARERTNVESIIPKRAHGVTLNRPQNELENRQKLIDNSIKATYRMVL
jgi:hypothetical protein